MSFEDGLFAREKHTLYAPGTPEETHELIEAGTAEDPTRRLNENAFRVDWSSPEQATIRTSGGWPRCSMRVKLFRHEWGSTAEATTQLDPFQALIAWLLLIGCGAVTVAMAVNRADGKSLDSALVPFGLLVVVALFALLWMYSRTGKRDDAMVHDLATAIGANSVDGVLSPQYALRPNWPPPADMPTRADSTRANSTRAESSSAESSSA